jgi:hypothetical protein
VLILAAITAGCVGWSGHLPAVAFGTAGGAKMLRPDARASACRTRVLGLTLGPGGAPLDEAVHALLALDPEADALTDVRVESRTLSAGLFDRSCVTVQANVVRTIPVVNLPMPPGHHHEHP